MALPGQGMHTYYNSVRIFFGGVSAKSFVLSVNGTIFQAICKTARTIAKPIIAEQIPKYKIDSVEFEALSLGSLPPTFQGSSLSLSPSLTTVQLHCVFVIPSLSYMLLVTF